MKKELSLKLVDKEFESYKQYCLEYFPKSDFNNEIHFLRKNITRIFKCIYLVQVVKDSVKYGVSDAQYEIVLDSEYILIRLLYILPHQDRYFVFLGFRAIAENILRICWLTESSNKIIDARNSQYRFLWSDIKKKKIYKDHKEILNQINDIFGKSSNIIHNKVPEKKIISYLTDLQEGTTRISNEELNKRINAITSSFFDIIFSVYPLNHQTMTSTSFRILAELIKD
ncbi:hypothetical protein [Enterococcus sp. 2201sp1_2201st1_B8_2201SCRN_220225]|uniref:hypothetical protein n=1 Tax=unclassified Enterococcus TaxID=2608891 RepID=UPI0034A1F9F6